MTQPLPTIRAGVPAIAKAVYHAIRFVAHDPAVFITIPGQRSILIIRDVELERAKKTAKADRVYVPKDFTPASGLSGDREIATAQSAAECLRRHGVRRVVGDRSLPLLYVEMLREVGIELVLDPDLSVFDRRQKDDQEVSYLRQAQQDTESAVRMACEVVRRANPRSSGELEYDGDVLTSERLRTLIDLHLLKLGYANEGSIVAGGPIGADCHHPGTGALRTGEPVIIDVFPQNKTTLYHGDCTRMTIQGDVPPLIARLHAIVVEAKRAAVNATRAGVTGDSVHHATLEVMKRHKVHIGFPLPGATDDLLFLPHGTGHGIGLDLKEPPLLDFNGVDLVSGDAVTIEPAVYCKAVGGVRIEDLCIVRETGCENLNALPEAMDEW